MASASKSQTTKRSEAPNKIKIQMNGSSAKVIHDEGDDSDARSSDSSSHDSPKVSSKSKKGKESSKEDQSKKKKEAPVRVDLSVLENVTCTACGRQLNPYKNNSVQKHPELKVIICKKCDKFLSSGQIAKDKDGADEQCRWCGEGGRLVVCDHCSCAFCKACVMRNFNRSAFNNINSQDSWRCYICDKSQLQGLKENYRSVRDAMKSIQAKNKEKEQAALTKEATAAAATGNGNSSSNGTGPQAAKSLGDGGVSGCSSSSGGSGGEDVALCVKDLEVDYMRVEVVMDKLSTATNTFQQMLRALKSEFPSTSTSPKKPGEETSSFNFTQGLSRNGKRQRCARLLNKGLQTYFNSLRKILQPQDCQTSNSCSQTSGVSRPVCVSGASVSARSNPPVSILDDDSSEDSSESGPSSSVSKGKVPKKTPNKDNDTFSKTKARTESESLKGKLSVTSLFSKPSKTPSNKSNNSFKSCAVVNETDKGDEICNETQSVESPEENVSSLSDPDDISKDKSADAQSSHDNKNKGSSKNKPVIGKGKTVSEKALETSKDNEVVDENVAAKLSMIQQLTEISGSEEENNSENSEEDDEDGPTEGVGKSTNEGVRSSPRKGVKKSPTEGAGKSTDEGVCSSNKGVKKVETKEKDSSGSSRSRPPVGKETSKPSNVRTAKQKTIERSESKSDDDDDDVGNASSSSDPLDSDEDSVDGSSKTKKRKASEKDAEKAKAKTTASGKETNKATEKQTKETKGGRAQPARNGAKTSNGLPAQSKTKDKEGRKKTEKSKANDDDEGEDDEVDKEIEKLSKLPTVQKRKTRGAQKNEKVEEKPEVKKGTRQSKRAAAKNKEEVADLDDLSSDGAEVNKSESEEEEMDSDLEPTVSFAAPNNEDDAAAEDNMLAKNQLLEDDDVEDDGAEDDEEGDDSSDDEDDEKPKKNKSTKDEKKSKPKKEENDDEEEEGKSEDEGSDSDDNVVGKKKRMRSKLLDSKLTDSDSDIGVSKEKKSKDEDADAEEEEESSSGSSLDSDSDDKDESSEEEDDDDEEGGKKKGKKKGKKRRRRKKKKGGSDEEDEEEGESGKGKKGKKRKRIKKMSDSSDDDDDKGGFGKRKKIRKVMSNKKLEDTTKAAARAEEKRRKRIAAKQREFNIETVTDENNPMNAPMTTKLILEPGKEEGDDPIVAVNKKLIRKLKPHQVDGVQFMWDCMYESVKRSKKEEGAGCILAHCMGLGKTLSVISFVHTIMTHHKVMNQRTCLVVCPLNTVLNWRNEWIMWFDKKDQLEVWELASCKQNVARAEMLREWQESGGIMIIGYEMYRNLTMGARIKNKKQKKTFQEALVDPGPDLCVCDEGHILKNENSSLSKSMNMMKTRRRIVLTGTPLQNNLNEYHCMVSFVKPNLLGTRKEFNNRFISPIQNGQCTDSTPRDVRIMKARAHVLHEMLAGCVQRRDYSALTKFLPPKQEYVMSIRLSNVQVELYQKYLELTGQGVDGVFNNKGARLFKDYQNLMKIWTHPWVLKLAEIRDELKMKYSDEEDSFIDDETDEERSASSSSSDSEENIISDSGDDEASPKGPHGKKGTKRTRAKARRQAGEDSDPEEVIAEWKTKMRGQKDGENIKMEPVDNRVTNQWWADYVVEEDKTKLELSNKLYLLFEILRMCEEIGDKVLIFSQSILSLNIIEGFLETVDNKFQDDMEKKMEADPDKTVEDDPDAEKEEFGKCWTKNLDYYRMDGSTSAHHRQMWAENFNDVDNYRARLFLISTKAGGLGINLVAANRVIIFDASWNPSHDVQSIFRVYRFGQTKPCYIYRFLAQGTMEEKIYERQVTKLSLSQRVVDEHQIERHFSANDLRELYNFKPEKWVEEGEHATLALPKDPLLAEILKTHRKCVVTFHEHDSLLENQIEQTLSEEEKKAAWEEYENEKKGIIVRGPGMGSAGASWPMMAAAQILSKEQIAATVHALRQQLPDLPEDVFHMHVQQALRRQVQMKQDEMRRMEMMRIQELTYMNMMQQQQEMGGMSGMGAMQNMAPWMQIQQLRAMQNHLMRGNRGYGMMGATSSNQLSNRPEEAINLDESPSKG